MAGFLLDISGKSESAVFSHRRKNDTFENDSISGDLDYTVLDIIGVDQYKDSSWSGLKLEKWAKLVKNQYEQCQHQIEGNVLKQLNKENIEEWMLPVIDNQKRGSTGYVLLNRLMEMIELALKNNGTIVFIGD